MKNQLLESMEECDRLQKSMKEMESNHARVEEGFVREMEALTNIHDSCSGSDKFRTGKE